MLFPWFGMALAIRSYDLSFYQENNMSYLTKPLRHILNGLAMQYAPDYLSDSEKQANLKQALEKIELEKQQAKEASPNPAIKPVIKPATNHSVHVPL